MNALKDREWIIILFFLALLLSLLVIAKVSNIKVDKEIKHLLSNERQFAITNLKNMLL